MFFNTFYFFNSTNDWFESQRLFFVEVTEKYDEANNEKNMYEHKINIYSFTVGRLTS